MSIRSEVQTMNEVRQALRAIRLELTTLEAAVATVSESVEAIESEDPPAVDPGPGDAIARFALLSQGQLWYQGIDVNGPALVTEASDGITDEASGDVYTEVGNAILALAP